MIDKKLVMLVASGALLGGCNMVAEDLGGGAGLGNGSQAAEAVELTEEEIAALAYRDFPGINKCFGDWAQNDWPRDMQQLLDNGEPNPNFGVSEAFLQGPRADGSPVLPERSDPSHAAGGPNGNPGGGYTSLGIGGELIVRMPLLIRDQQGDDILLHEVTGGSYNCDNYPEFAQVQVSYDGDTWAWLAGEVCGNGSHGFDLATLGPDAPWQLKHFGARFVRVVDTSNANDLPGDADGFDLDSVEAVHCGGNDPEANVCEGAFRYAEENQGLDDDGLAIVPERSNAAAALGMPERIDDAIDETDPVSFYTMGLGGSIVLTFNGYIPVTNDPAPDFYLAETSYGRLNQGCAFFEELVDVEVSDGGDWHFVGHFCRNVGVDVSALTGVIDRVEAVRLTDTSTRNGSDGYDIDGIDCAENDPPVNGPQPEQPGEQQPQ